MISDKYKKGTQVYDAVYWLLKHYYEFKFYNIVGESELIQDIADAEHNDNYSICDVITFAEKEESCIRRTRVIVDYAQSEYCAALIQIMDRSLERLAGYGGHCIGYADIIRKRFMCKNRDSESNEKLYSGYYEKLRCALERYCEIFAEIIKRNRNCFFDINTNEDIVNETALLRRVYAIHSREGICYKDTVKLLKSYKDIKYSGIQQKIGDSSQEIEEFLCNEKSHKNEYEKALDRIEYINLPSNMKKWMYSSMIETTNAYICFVEEALRRMSWLGEKGRSYRRILEILFTDPEWYDENREAKMQETGLTSRKFYEQRRRAIEMMSKILWGVLAHRHCASVFYKR